MVWKNMSKCAEHHPGGPYDIDTWPEGIYNPFVTSGFL